MQSFPGLNGTVLAATVWDPDGDGPLPPVLVLGGQFTVAGDAEAARVVVYDGERFTPLGEGFNGDVNALTVWNGRLIAGGTFFSSGFNFTQRIAYWEPAAGGGAGEWRQVGPGLFGTVNALAAYGGELYVGGAFDQQFGDPANIARLVGDVSGGSWAVVGTGLNNTVSALAVHDSGDGPELYAGGLFVQTAGPSPQTLNRVGRWNGSAWQPLGTPTVNGTNGHVRSFTTWDGRLVLGGDFNGASIPGIGVVSVNRIAVWDGAALAALPAGGAAGFGSGGVYALAVLGGELYAAGQFAQAAAAPGTANAVNNIARYDGSGWRALGTPGPTAGVSGLVRALPVFQGSLYPVGAFTNEGTLAAGTFTGGAPQRAAQWDGERFRPLAPGFNGGIQAAGLWGDRLVVAGTFTAVNGVPAYRIAVWDGESWSALGEGLRRMIDDVEFDQVFDIADYNGTLVIAGQLPREGRGGGNLWRWDPVTGVFEILGGGAGPNLSVYALLVKDGLLYFGGSFNRIDGDPAFSRIAAWNGSSFASVGPTITGSGSSIYALHDLGGAIVAGGSSFNFPGPAGNVTGLIARLGPDGWERMGDGLGIGPGFHINPGVWAFAEYDGKLVAAGKFDRIGGPGGPATGPIVRSVVAFDGVSWSDLAGGLTPSLTGGNSTRVRDLAVYNGRLYATGEFNTAPGNLGSANFISALNAGGGQWESIGFNFWPQGLGLPGGFDGAGRAFLPIGGDELVVGGLFTRADTRLSQTVATITAPEGPSVGVSPTSADPEPGSTVMFTATPVGNGPFFFQWRRESSPGSGLFVDLVNGQTPAGTFVSGANSPMLTLSNLAPGDAVVYSVRVADTCGATATAEAAFDDACPADFNADGVVNTADITAFLSAWFAARAGGPAGGADFNADGVVNTADITAFLSAWFAARAGGC